MQECRPTRTQETEQDYIARATRLLERYRCASGETWQADPVAACEWIASQRTGWSRSTWRAYRAALVYFMEKNGPIEAVSVLGQSDTSPCKAKGEHTSAKKMKSFSVKHLTKIVKVLGEGQGKNDLLLGLWVTVNRLVGLRPIEWETAVITDKVLVVQNAKSTNGRSHGETRHLLLSGLSQQDREALYLFVETLRKTVDEYGDFKKVQKACSCRLWKVTRRLWPNRSTYPTLYSTRHQFSADLKKQGRPCEEIAALFGHATDKTASEHYGRGKYGESRGGSVVPPSEEVERVRRLVDLSKRPFSSNKRTVES